MDEKKSGKKAVGIAMAVLILGSVFAMLAPASIADHPHEIPAGATAIIYFHPDNTNSPDCSAKTIQVYVNTTKGITAGQLAILYNPQCINVTNWALNKTIWTSGGGWDSRMDGLEWITFYRPAPEVTGDLLIGTLTVQCNASCCCGTNLNLGKDPRTGQPTAIFNATGGLVPHVPDNGTFICGKLLEVTKTVWDPDANAWVDALGPLSSDWKDKDVIFNITVNSKCVNLSNVRINDVMDPSLKYNDSASRNPVSSTAQTVNWTLASLPAGTSQSITFNATIVDYGTNMNTVTVTATVADLDVDIQAQDDASVTTMPPARIIVNKTVWDPVAGAWVAGINNAKIGDTYRFRCVITNGGSPGMDLTNITVWDILSPSMEYADDAVLTTPAGTTWNIEPPTSVTTLPDGSTMVNWTIDDYLQSPLKLLVGQSLVIEFNATVVNYGNDTNTQFAKGWCDAVHAWIVGNDTAYINTPKPDLTVSDITINYDASGVGGKAVGPRPGPGVKTECNNISAVVEEDSGIDVVFPFNVTFAEKNLGTLCTVRVDNLAGHSNKTVYCDCSDFRPKAGDIYSISVTVDSDSEILESDETNNTMWNNGTAIWNGYKGDGWEGPDMNLTNGQCHEQGTINLTYSPGDSYYQSGWSTWDPYPYTVNWTPDDLNIPPTDTYIKKARLYVYYHGDEYFQYKGINISPEQAIANLSLTFNGFDMTPVAKYSDRKGFGSWDYSGGYGVLVYDVTDKLIATGNNTAKLYNNNPDHKGVSIEGMVLAVVYNNTNEPERIIWIREGCDLLKSAAKYGVTPEEATTYVPFTGCEPIPTSEIVNAKLVTIAGTGNYGDDYNRLFFNGQLIGHGLWSSGYYGSTNIGINETEIPREFIQPTNNTVAYQDNGDMFAVDTVFLILEKGKAEIAVEVPIECIGQGEQFIVNVTVNPRGIPIYGVEYEISFDPTVLHAEWQNEGDFLKQDGASTNVYINNIDNTAGKLTFAVTRVGTQTGVTTPGILARIGFTALKQGASTTLTFTKVKMSDPDANSVPAESVNGTVNVCENLPPVAVGWSEFRYNNVGSKYLSKAFFNGSLSHDQDADGCITNYRWAFGDGNYGSGMTTEHIYDSWKWNGSSYEPFTAILTVEDDGTPILDNSTSFPMNVFIAGDANGDGVVDIFDGVIVGLEWDHTANFNGTCYWYDNERGDRADLNNDKIVDIFDAVIVGANWEHTAY